MAICFSYASLPFLKNPSSKSNPRILPTKKRLFITCKSGSDPDEGYLLDAPVSVGDGFSFSGGKYSDEPSPADIWFAQGNIEVTTQIRTLIHQLNNQFSLKSLGDVSYFLGIEVFRSKDKSLFLTQTKYARDLMLRTTMQNAKPLPTPMSTEIKLSSRDGDPFDNVTLYRSIVGALQYLTITRLDIAYSVNKVCQFMQTPLYSHWRAVKRILHYVNGTHEYGIRLGTSPTLNFNGYCDADWGSDPDDRRSMSGFCWFLGDSPRSSSEAEYRSLANATSELLWIISLMSELHIPLSSVPVLWCDNVSTIALSANPVLHAQTKHLELDLHFVREKILSKFFSVRYVPSYDQAVMF